jgi:ABC-type nitrate/sulfonate/bicarbonate transport system permease component
LPRIYSLAALIAVWALAAALAQSRLLPGPLTVGAATLADIRSGELPFQMGCTLKRAKTDICTATNGAHGLQRTARVKSGKAQNEQMLIFGRHT